MAFLKKLKDIFNKIPSKTKFLDDIGFSNSYIGFRYFLQGRNEKPSAKFMEKICSELDYDYIRVPIKLDEQNEFLDKLHDKFIEDLETYLEKYNDTPIRTYTKNKTGVSSVSAAVAAFEIEKEILDPDKKLDVSDLF